MEAPKVISLKALFLFTLAFVPITSLLLGEFFWGNDMFILMASITVCGISLLSYLMIAFLSAELALMGILSKSLMDIFILFPILSLKYGFSRLVYQSPFRAGIGAAFSLSFLCVFSFSIYFSWPRISSKLSLSGTLSAEEKAWGDFRVMKNMLKAYKRLYGKYPSQENLVQELENAQPFSDRIKEGLKSLKIQKAGSYSYIVDPWGAPYVYNTYKKLGLLPSYRFYSTRVRFMK